MRFVRGLLLLASVLALFVGANGSASAHGLVVFQGRDSAVLTDDHVEVFACDREKDGHLVYADVWTDQGRYHIFDEDGSRGGCWSEVFGERVVSFRACEEAKGCSDWVKVS